MSYFLRLVELNWGNLLPYDYELWAMNMMKSHRHRRALCTHKNMAENDIKSNTNFHLVDITQNKPLNWMGHKQTVLFARRWDFNCGQNVTINDFFSSYKRSSSSINSHIQSKLFAKSSWRPDLASTNSDSNSIWINTLSRNHVVTSVYCIDTKWQQYAFGARFATNLLLMRKHGGHCLQYKCARDQ